MTTTTTTLSKSEQAAADLTALLKARVTLIWVVTREETRVERQIIDAAAAAKYRTDFWDCAAGFVPAEGQPQPTLIDPQRMLKDTIPGIKDRRVFVLRDLHKWMSPQVLRHLRNVSRDLQGAPRAEARTVVVISPSSDVPAELEGHASVIDWPLPERKEIADVLDTVLAGVAGRDEVNINGDRDLMIDAAVGLTAEEAATCYSKSLVMGRTIDVPAVTAEKRRVIAKDGLLEWIDTDGFDMDSVGGLEHLKAWLKTRRNGLSQRAREFGLPAPKGVLIAGVPGCGKSLTAKCVPAAWGLPLLRLDLGGIRSKWQGESESNLRKALATAEAVSPCVVWIDEVEKALAGSGGSGEADGGTSADALGTILSWMQERTGSVFVVATANDVSVLPPELLRKGRFDDLFFVDLPTRSERREIAAAAIRAHDRDPETIDLDAVAADTDGFSGAEIAALIPDALFVAFEDGERDLTTDDVISAASEVAPLSQTAEEKVTGLREWAKGRARKASADEEAATVGAGVGRDLDF
jgi:AAA+ superfamily predicted ATPase